MCSKMTLVGLFVVCLMALPVNGDFHDLYVGCYGDNETRAMGYPVETSELMAIKMCYYRCYNRTNTYFGLEPYLRWGGCFCGDSYNRYGTRETCKVPCQGNASEICGDQWALSVYSVCPSGFFGQACDMMCHCLEHTDYGVRCYRNGTCLAGCQPGWTGSGCHLESDINECATNNGGCEQSCINTQGSYSCDCDSGFTLNADGIHCDDVNECADNNGGCDQNCINTPGSYSCTCDSGFTLNADGIHCDDINECASDPCLNGGTCVDAVNGYSCDCPVLYTGSNCELVTACQITSEDKRHSCGVASKTEQECINAGCCWDGTHANMMCFRKIIKQHKPKCSAAQSKRIQCPGVFTTEDECKAASCCWDNKPKPGMDNCYLPDQ